nr:MAG TPA: hypothetical protein [Caudoviricetes sp.]
MNYITYRLSLPITYHKVPFILRYPLYLSHV